MPYSPPHRGPGSSCAGYVLHIQLFWLPVFTLVVPNEKGKQTFLIHREGSLPMAEVHKITSKERLTLRKFIKQLEHHRGRHTELVTVYVPAGYEMAKIIQHLQQEQGTASNIKSSATRKNVTDALERMIQHLKLFTRTPPNGLMVFSGNVAEREGQSDVQVWSLEPPVPLNLRLYRCDKDFKLDALQEMVESREIYALVVLDRRDAMFALLKGKRVVPLVETHSHVPGKFKAGGQSAARFARLREIAIHEHFKKIGDYMKEQFFEMRDQLKGILIGGPAVTTNDFVNGNYITGELQRKIIAIKDLSYTGEFGLQELLDKSQDVLAAEEVAEEKAIVNKLLLMLAKEPGKVAYGEKETMKALEMGGVDVLLLSEDLPDEKIEQWEEKAQALGTTTMIISVETREGVQLRDLGRVAAILRYDMTHQMG